MGQLALILALGALLVGGVLFLNVQRTTQDADDATGAYQVDQFAREAALTGLDQAERRLNANPDSWDLWNTNRSAARDSFEVPATTVDDATYAVTLDSIYIGSDPTDPDQAWVTATGTYGGWDPGQDSSGTTVFTIVATYEKGYTNIGTPPSMRHAIVADQTLDMRGNTVVSGSVHANGELNTHGGSFDVLGAGSSTNGGTYNDGQFTGGVTYPADSIYVPDVVLPDTWDFRDPDDFPLNASSDPPGTLEQGWNGVTGKGTAADPYVLRVDGNLAISGDVRLLGYCRIYVGGTVGFGGNATLSPVSAVPPNVNNATNAQIQSWIDTNLPNGSTLAIYARGDITIDGTVLAAAHLYSNGTVRFTGGGNKLVIGGVTAGEDLDIRGNSKVFYTDANASILNPGFDEDVPDGLRLIAYREWARRPSDP
jgi:hypothetical protein